MKPIVSHELHIVMHSQTYFTLLELRDFILVVHPNFHVTCDSVLCPSSTLHDENDFDRPIPSAEQNVRIPTQ